MSTGEMAHSAFDSHLSSSLITLMFHFHQTNFSIFPPFLFPSISTFPKKNLIIATYEKVLWYLDMMESLITILGWLKVHSHSMF